MEAAAAAIIALAQITAHRFIVVPGKGRPGGWAPGRREGSCVRYRDPKA
jgi:hypothetical protein